jgi:hypothetical protein
MRRRTFQTLAWVLSAAMAAQPVAAFSCGCKPLHGTTSGPTPVSRGETETVSRATCRDCCRKSTTSHAPANRTSNATASCLLSEWSCCAGACSCVGCRDSRGATLFTTSLQRVSADEFQLQASAPCVFCPASDGKISVQPAWTADFLPSHVSASQRCTILCRLLF